MPKTVVVVGSGPIGATYARLVLEQVPDASVLMFELGPRLTSRPGVNVRNIPDVAMRERAQSASQGPQSSADQIGALGIPDRLVQEGTFTARQGTHLVNPVRPDAGFPAAAVSTCVGGQGAHWTCATPRPRSSERIPFLPDELWEPAITTAEALLGVSDNLFEHSPTAAAIRELLRDEFAGELPDDGAPGVLPVAARRSPDGAVTWSGTDFVLGPLADDSSELASRFALRALTLVRTVHHVAGRVTAVTIEDAVTGEQQVVEADAIVVAADALRSPQLLWASGIRPPALGHFLTEHPAVLSTVALGDRVVRAARTAGTEAAPVEGKPDPVSGVNRIPFSDPEHPFSAQIMFVDRVAPALVAEEDLNPAGYAHVGWGLRKFPRYEDSVTFDDAQLDYRGFPAMSIDYALTEREFGEIAIAKSYLERAAAVLGEFVPGAEPRLMPNGSSLHYQGTMRMGETDDGSSVCDPQSRVWGFENLVVGGNALIPTATSANPTLTSVALAVIGATALAERLTASTESPPRPR